MVGGTEVSVEWRSVMTEEDAEAFHFHFFEQDVVDD